MDFTWVPDTRKLTTFTNNSNNSSTNNTNNDDLMQSESLHRTISRSNSRLSLTALSQNTNNDTARRARAGTMPSSTISPFNSSLGSSNFYLSQQRPNQDSFGTSFYPHSGMSSPLDENTTDSIASTLASLGLNDDDVDTKPSTQSYFEPVTRHRAFTVSARNTNIDSDVMSYTPFRPSRPRAISLGNQSDFSPFVSETTPSSGSNLEPPAQAPSRALWLGNITPSLSVPELHKVFARYGKVESARILSDKECAFVNFETVESALAAKEDLVNRLGCKVGGSVVKVGFGKADVGLAMALSQDGGPNAQGPTRSIWVGNIPSNVNPTVLRSIFQQFGPIESIRILSHKNCGFINFERQEDAVHARKYMQNKEILGPGTGTVRIGFARDPTYNPDEIIQDVVISGNTITSYATPNQLKHAENPQPTSSVSTPAMRNNAPEKDTANTTQWATVILMARMMMNAQQQQQPETGSSSSSAPALTNSSTSATERKLIMQQLGYEPSPNEVENAPISYYSTIPLVPEFGSDRMLGPLRLREIKKSLDNGQGIPEIESIAKECMDEIVELCSDYIGNTVVQKLFEFCSEETKSKMIMKIAPYLASIGVHKNGTWAAQKIIDTAHTEEQIHVICSSIAPYVPLLLLDQYGNYVVQCCLSMGPTYNQYIFDAIVEKCWEIGQGRFGARSVRAILENPIVTKNQQIYVAAAIMQNALLLTTNANGSILLNWLLDTSGLLGHFNALCNVK